MRRMIVRLIGPLLGLLGLYLLYCLLPIEVRPAAPPTHQPAPPAVLTLEAVQSLSQLVTTKLTLHQTASTVSEGWLGELTQTCWIR